ncbi:MAG: hypothetical protein J5527_09320 [Treponema sp.]|nr:hypothetical protein [Treponema sp.]
MKNNYRIDAKFYFSLTVFYKKIIKDFEDENVIEIIKEEGIKEAKRMNIRDYDNWNSISIKRINTLSRTIGSVIFEKNKRSFYGKLDDIFQIIIPYSSMKKYLHKNNNSMTVKDALINNMKENDKLKNIKDFESLFKDDYFDKAVYPKELKNIRFYIIHNYQKKENE